MQSDGCVSRLRGGLPLFDGVACSDTVSGEPVPVLDEVWGAELLRPELDVDLNLRLSLRSPVGVPVLGSSPSKYPHAARARPGMGNVERVSDPMLPRRLDQVFDQDGGPGRYRELKTGVMNKRLDHLRQVSAEILVAVYVMGQSALG